MGAQLSAPLPEQQKYFIQREQDAVVEHGRLDVHRTGRDCTKWHFYNLTLVMLSQDDFHCDDLMSASRANLINYEIVMK